MSDNDVSRRNLGTKQTRGKTMRRLAWLETVTLAILSVVFVAEPARAEYPGPNGQIAFIRQIPDTEEGNIFIANPDGTHEHELPLAFLSDAFTAAPIWSPDGSRILVTPYAIPDAPGRPATVNPDGSEFTLLTVPDLPHDAGIGCKAWSPDGKRLLCQVDASDASLSGIYTIRSSDGGDLTRLTDNPYPPTGDFGGGDVPGDYSPDGTRFVFMRAKPGADPNARHQRGALFVANADGTGLRQITRYGLANSHANGVAHWSPDGSEIIFASAHGSLFVVHPDSSGLRAIPLETGGGFSYAFSPGWSPDGNNIVFSLYLDSSGQIDIFTASADGSNVVQVTDTPDFEDFADWGAAP